MVVTTTDKSQIGETLLWKTKLERSKLYHQDQGLAEFEQKLTLSQRASYKITSLQKIVLDVVHTEKQKSIELV